LPSSASLTKEREREEKERKRRKKNKINIWSHQDKKITKDYKGILIKGQKLSLLSPPPSPHPSFSLLFS